MRIAHLSDLHLLDLTGAVPMRLFNKRITGYANLKLKREHAHKPEPVRAAIAELAGLGIDHLVVTGDVSNLALEREFDRVLEVLEVELGLGADDISLVPGNHDAYTRGAHRARRFATWFARYTTSDLDGIATESGFPFVRLRGPVAIIGLSTARPRPPLVASGTLGSEQLAALGRALAHPSVRERTPVLLQHHPIHNPKSLAKTLLEGLTDASSERRVLDRLERGLVLHGHLHRRLRRELRTASGSLHAVGSTSASLLHDDPDRMAGFNLYEIGDDGEILELSARRYDGQGFEPASIPLVD